MHKAKYRFVNLFRIGLPALLFTACATMLSKKEDQITVKSDPPGAFVISNADTVGKTPFTLNVPHSTFDQPYVILKKDGYEPVRVNFEKQIEPTSLFNIGFLCISETSWGIDALSGALLKYSPTGYLIELKQKKPSNSASYNPKRQARELAVLGWDALRRDVAAGDGEFLRGYYSMAYPYLEYAYFLQTLDAHRPELVLATDGLAWDSQVTALFGS